MTKTSPPVAGNDPTTVQPEPEPAFGRVLAFSDGVFAFAITLMVLAIRAPRPNDPDAGSGLLTLLIDQWPLWRRFSPQA